MYSTTLIAALCSLIPFTTAVPLWTRDNATNQINTTTFSNLQLFSQYAAAAYCSANTANTNTSTPISCGTSGNCPLLTTNPPVLSLWEFSHTFWTDVTGFIAVDPTRKLVVLTFRGTHSFRNWLANLDAGLAETDICPNCQAWKGFWTSWEESREGIMDAFKGISASYPGYKTVVVGHSLGGAIADLAAADLRGQGMDLDLYTYGAPRVGGPLISSFISGNANGAGPNGNGTTFRVTHFDDPVPKLPPRGWGFADVGPEYWISTGNGVEVGIGDVSVYEGTEMGTEGDFGDIGIGSLLRLDVAAHLWYFGSITGCDRKAEGLFDSG